MTDPQAEFYTPKKVAELLQVSVDVIYDCMERGEIPGLKVGRIWRIHHTVIDDLIAKACGRSAAS